MRPDAPYFIIDFTRQGESSATQWVNQQLCPVLHTQPDTSLDSLRVTFHPHYCFIYGIQSKCPRRNVNFHIITTS